jgi:hypothetical protein
LCGLNYANQEYEDGNACCELCKQEIDLGGNIVKSIKGIFLKYHE